MTTVLLHYSSIKLNCQQGTDNRSYDYYQQGTELDNKLY